MPSLLTWLACDLLKTLMATACWSSSTACKTKLGKGQEAIPSPLALWNQVTSTVGSLLWKVFNFRDLVWIQTPWKEADLLTTLMRIKRTRKTCSRIETDAWKVGSYKYKRAESIQNSQACSTVPFLHGNLNCLGCSTSKKDLPNRVAL